MMMGRDRDKVRTVLLAAGWVLIVAAILFLVAAALEAK